MMPWRGGSARYKDATSRTAAGARLMASSSDSRSEEPFSACLSQLPT
jgi:hypothetical protein